MGGERGWSQNGRGKWVESDGRREGVESKWEGRGERGLVERQTERHTPLVNVPFQSIAFRLTLAPKANVMHARGLVK